LIDAHSAAGLTPLICDLDGSVLEAGYAAILLITGETITAPPLDGRRLPSISRGNTLAAASAAGFVLVQRPITLAELEAADAIVLTSSLRGPHLGVLGDGRPGTLPERLGMPTRSGHSGIAQPFEPTRSIG
jgi:branched-subunit amino acid aminotransferase/4-amino-4-deoxychorismate lyase